MDGDRVAKAAAMGKLAAAIRSMAENRCWICGDIATTGEHIAKRSDLRAVFGKRGDNKQVYLHDARQHNQPVRGFDAKILKSPARLCAKCNNERTQPHDRAWERMSDYLGGRRPLLAAGDIVRARNVFPYDTSRYLLNVYLYFLKQFGCMIVEGKIPLDIRPVSRAIMENAAHPCVYIQFAMGAPRDGRRLVSRSHLRTLVRNSDGKTVLAVWFYQVNEIAVNVVFADPSEPWENLSRTWHPRFGTNRLVIAEYEWDADPKGKDGLAASESG